MKKNMCARFVVAWALFVIPVGAQDVQVNRQNRTIAVTITETVRVKSEVAVVNVGYRNSAKTKQLAFEENLRLANRITKALLDAGIPKENIETESVRLGDTSRQWPLEASKQQNIEAHQSWKVRVAVADAEKVINLMVDTGANEVGEIDWIVADSIALEAKANSAALAKARALAEKMAGESKLRVGELLYLSNQEPLGESYGGGAGYFSMAAPARRLPPPKLTVFPKQVERQETVHAVFALEQ